MHTYTGIIYIFIIIRNNRCENGYVTRNL